LETIEDAVSINLSIKGGLRLGLNAKRVVFTNTVSVDLGQESFENVVCNFIARRPHQLAGWISGVQRPDAP
jgi:hypothetical protein